MDGGESRVSAGATVRIARVVESAADARTVAALIDKVLLEHEEHPEWLDDGVLPNVRGWVKLSAAAAVQPAPPHTTWTDLKKRGPRVLGFGGSTKNPYAVAARRAIKAAGLEREPPSALVMVVDADAQPERLGGLEEGRRMDQPRFTVVVGAADPKREAWLLNAFVPESDAEKKALAELASALGFDPCTEAHRLRDKRGESRDPKRVLRELVGEVVEDSELLNRASLATLRERGTKTGLAGFVGEAAELRSLF